MIKKCVVHLEAKSMRFLVRGSAFSGTTHFLFSGYDMNENINKTKICCFIGHRTINKTEELREKLQTIIEKMITENDVDTFLFGSKSDFADLCHEIVTDLKEKHSNIKRIFVRAEYPDINEDYENYLLRFYENTYFPEKMRNSGRAVYIKRNYEMIDKSEFCVVYYDEKISPIKRKSGTKIAFEYATKKNRKTINIAHI